MPLTLTNAGYDGLIRLFFPPKKILAARKITIKRGLTDIKTTERETATFEVELSHPQVVGMWMRNGIQLKQTNHFRMSAKGKVHSLTVSNLSIEDTGTFMFCVERQKTSARLVVKGRSFFCFFLKNVNLQRLQQCYCSDFAASSDWQLKGSARNRLQAKQCRHDNRKVTALLLLRKLTLQHKIAFA